MNLLRGKATQMVWKFLLVFRRVVMISQDAKLRGILFKNKNKTYQQTTRWVKRVFNYQLFSKFSIKITCEKTVAIYIFASPKTIDNQNAVTLSFLFLLSFFFVSTFFLFHVVCYITKIFIFHIFFLLFNSCCFSACYRFLLVYSSHCLPSLYISQSF